jgi:diguanylate cyclase (GGDEF)-like protein
MQGIEVLLVVQNSVDRNKLNAVLTHGRPMVRVRGVASQEEFVLAMDEQQYDCLIIDSTSIDPWDESLSDEITTAIAKNPLIIVSREQSQAAVVRVMRKRADFIRMEAAIRGNELWRRVAALVDSSRQQGQRRRRRERRMRWITRMAVTDALSGLPNRHYFHQAIKAGRWSKDRRGLGCLMADIDRFKQFNDTYGHTTGDKVIRHVANLIHCFLNKGDTAIRWGGEEFLVIVEQPRASETWLAARRLREIIESHPIVVDAQSLPITCSIGVQHAVGGTFSLAEIELADRSLFLAKESGRNRVCTGPMAQARQAVQDLRASGVHDPLELRNCLISKMRMMLGTNQYRMLTNHCEQVRDMALRIASQMRDVRIDTACLNRAAMCHELATLFLPEYMLAKPSRLTCGERELFNQHSELGAWAAQWLGLDKPACKMIREHHLDQHSRQETACTGSQILHVADAIVAMQSPRPFRPAMTVKQIYRELSNHEHTHLHPAVLDAALKTRWCCRPQAA